MTSSTDRKIQNINSLQLVPFAHPQGCRGYILADQSTKEALALDAHLDLVDDIVQRINSEGWKLRHVVDTHTHADHPSGAGELAAQFDDCKRMAHEKANHAGLSVKAEDGRQIDLGNSQIIARHAPGHTPDHMVLIADGALFSGDSLFIGGVVRTDFLGGDAGQLFDSIHAILTELSGKTLLLPGHDYQGRMSSTLAEEKNLTPGCK